MEGVKKNEERGNCQSPSAATTQSPKPTVTTPDHLSGSPSLGNGTVTNLVIQKTGKTLEGRTRQREQHGRRREEMGGSPLPCIPGILCRIRSRGHECED